MIGLLGAVDADRFKAVPRAGGITYSQFRENSNETIKGKVIARPSSISEISPVSIYSRHSKYLGMLHFYLVLHVGIRYNLTSGIDPGDMYVILGKYFSLVEHNILLDLLYGLNINMFKTKKSQQRKNQNKKKQ